MHGSFDSLPPGVLHARAPKADAKPDSSSFLRPEGEALKAISAQVIRPVVLLWLTSKALFECAQSAGRRGKYDSGQAVVNKQLRRASAPVLFDSQGHVVQKNNCCKRREGLYSRNNDCVNNDIGGRTLAEWYDERAQQEQEYMREY